MDGRKASIITDSMSYTLSNLSRYSAVSTINFGEIHFFFFYGIAYYLMAVLKSSLAKY